MVYQLFVWRKTMGVSWWEAQMTPEAVVLQDLEMISLENHYSKPAPKTQKGM